MRQRHLLFLILSEYLNMILKSSSESELYSITAFNTSVWSVDTSLVVKLESYLKVVVSVMKVVSGSIITGVNWSNSKWF